MRSTNIFRRNSKIDLLRALLKPKKINKGTKKGAVMVYGIKVMGFKKPNAVYRKLPRCGLY